MKAYFPIKALAMRGGLFAPGVLLVVLNHLRSVLYRFQELNMVWIHHKASAGDFMSIVSLSGALSRLILP